MKKWDTTGIENWGWKKQPLGATIPTAGNAVDNKTGGWRTERPVQDAEKCTNCLLCWINCPDSSVRVKDEKWDGFDYEHCKGCGICAKVCNVGAITMINERGEE
ncbi:MAG TPA: 4Fe-4S binding protein [Candidatus Aquicultor sp.]|jgi:pyruvate ferredoxin oxidoreductase delta subunit